MSDNLFHGFNSLTVANYIIKKLVQQKIDLTSIKLTKLVYIAHGLHLAMLHTPLINEPIYAPSYGPFIVSLYEKFKADSSQQITEPYCHNDVLLGDYFEMDMQAFLKSNTSREIVDTVWKNYSHLSTVELSASTRNAGTPWDMVRKENPHLASPPIENDLIRDFYEQIKAEAEADRSYNGY